MGKTKTGGTRIMDLWIFGIGIAVAFAIIALSAIILYLSFRIKSTFENDKSVKVQIVKTFFIVGVLFMAGGMFYYFAQAMSSGKADNTSRMIQNEAVSESGKISLGLAYPENVRVNDNYNMTFAVKSSAPNTIHNATIKITGLPLLGAKSNFGIEVDKLNLGDLQPGETDGFLQLKAPSYPIVLVGTMLLSSPDTDAVRQNVKINIIDASASSLNSVKNTTVNKTTPNHDDLILPSTNEPASSRSSAPVKTEVQNTNKSNETTNVSNNTVNNTTTPNNSGNNSSTNTTAPNVTATVEPTVTPTPTSSPTPTLTETPTSTPTPTPSPTPTLTETPTSTPTPTPSPTPTLTETPTPTPAPTTPEPTTPAPTTPVPTTPEPTTPVPTTPAPTTPEPTTPAPTTPAPTTPPSNST
jgi:hypothetical protein